MTRNSTAIRGEEHRARGYRLEGKVGLLPQLTLNPEEDLRGLKTVGLFPKNDSVNQEIILYVQDY